MGEVVGQVLALIQVETGAPIVHEVERLNALISLGVQRGVDFVKSFTNNLARCFADARLRKNNGVGSILKL